MKRLMNQCRPASVLRRKNGINLNIAYLSLTALKISLRHEFDVPTPAGGEAGQFHQNRDDVRQFLLRPCFQIIHDADYTTKKPSRTFGFGRAFWGDAPTILTVHLPLKSLPYVLRRAAGSGQKHRTAHGLRALSLLRSHPDEVRRSSVAPGPSINAARARQSVSERSEGRDSASHVADLECRAPQTPRLARSNRYV